MILNADRDLSVRHYRAVQTCGMNFKKRKEEEEEEAEGRRGEKKWSILRVRKKKEKKVNILGLRKQKVDNFLINYKTARFLKSLSNFNLFTRRARTRSLQILPHRSFASEKT